MCHKLLFRFLFQCKGILSFGQRICMHRFLYLHRMLLLLPFPLVFLSLLIYQPINFLFRYSVNLDNIDRFDFSIVYPFQNGLSAHRKHICYFGYCVHYTISPFVIPQYLSVLCGCAGQFIQSSNG